jgi:3'-phosphoadenosine 5'-phosphosulfate sulfotransferase (PAPS reductase)/FAD synthetase
MGTTLPEATRGISPAAAQETRDICARIQRTSAARDCDTITIAFSGGKDSLAMWLALDAYCPDLRVLPVYWYLVPRLGFVERALTYYEARFDTPILRLPHPDRFDMLERYSFQPPSRYTGIDWALTPVNDAVITMDTLMADVRRAYGIPDAFHGIGIRAADSPVRRTLYRKFGAFPPKGQLCYPVIGWTSADVEAALSSTRTMLPPEYRYYGRSFDGIMYRWLAPIREHYPADWARILGDFPLAELEFVRAETMEHVPYRFVGTATEDPWH